jgi:hypothetical protein
MGPTAGQDAVSKRKIPSPRRESNLDHPIVQPVVSRYETPFLTCVMIKYITFVLENEF